MLEVARLLYPPQEIAARLRYLKHESEAMPRSVPLMAMSRSRLRCRRGLNRYGIIIPCQVIRVAAVALVGEFIIEFINGRERARRGHRLIAAFRCRRWSNRPAGGQPMRDRNGSRRIEVAPEYAAIRPWMEVAGGAAGW
jgi:hypothetical protein